MPTRREQLQGYRFVTRRIVSALLSGEPETNDLPMRRLGLAVFASAMVAVIVFAGIGAYGLLRPGGSSSWQKEGALIIERESGTRYVYTGGRLYPVINYSSARLIAGNVEPVTVAASSLADVPRGTAVGIPGAPDSLPATGKLLGTPWTVCSSPRYASSTSLLTALMVGRDLPGGTGLGDSALLVSADTGTGQKYLLWRDHRLRIGSDTVLAELSLAGNRVVPVGQSLLDGIAQGPDLDKLQIPDQGRPGRAIGGRARSVGDVFRSSGGYYVLLDSGLAPIGAVAALLLLAGGQPADVPPDTVGQNLTETKVEPDGLPAGVPPVIQLSGNQPAVCASYRGGSAIALESYQQAPAQFTNTESTGAAPASSRDQVHTADRVIIPGGHGALVRAEPAPGVSAGGTIYLITDQREKFPLVRGDRSDALGALGYGGVHPVAVPRSLLDLVPTGPTLDPTAARTTAVLTGPTPSASPSKNG